MTDRTSRWLLVAVLGSQFLLFRSFVTREIAWAPPYHFDQVPYLAQAYGLHECLLIGDERTCLKDVLVGKHARLSANGVLLPVQAAGLSLFLGASRLTVLTVGFAYFALWQVATFALVRHLSGSAGKAWLALGLLLALSSPFLEIGGLADFRLDFPAASALGIHIALVLASRTFADRRLTVAAALVAAVLVLMRYLTALYIAGSWLVVAVACVWMCVRRRSPPAQATAARGRLVNLGIAIAVAVLVTGPSVWAGRRALYYYYLDPSVDHSIWGAKGAGPADGWLWYANAIADHHFGPLFGVAAALVLTVAFIPSHGDRTVPDERVPDRRLAWLFLAASSLIPFAILGLYPATNIPAAGIVVPGLVALCWHAIAVGGTPVGGWRAVRRAVIASALLVGIVNQARGYSRHSAIVGWRASAVETVALYDAIGRHCERMGWRRPRISTNLVRDELAAAGSSLTALYYERHGVFLAVEGRLGASVLEVTPAAALAALADSDFVLLAGAPRRSAARFPFESDMERLRPEVEAFVKRRFVPFGRHFLGSQKVDVYVRPSVRVDGTSGEWVTDAGLELRLSSVPPGSSVILQGRYPPEQGPELEASAFLVLPSGHETPLPTALRIAPPSYELRFVLPPGAGEVEEGTLVRIAFSKSFSSANGDPRRFVLGAPTETRVELP